MSLGGFSLVLHACPVYRCCGSGWLLPLAGPAFDKAGLAVRALLPKGMGGSATGYPYWRGQRDNINRPGLTRARLIVGQQHLTAEEVVLCLLALPLRTIRPQSSCHCLTLLCSAVRKARECFTPATTYGHVQTILSAPPYSAAQAQVLSAVGGREAAP